MTKKLLILFLSFSLTGQAMAQQKGSDRFMIRGVCWVAGDSIIDRNLNPLEENYVNWISQTPFGYQRGHDNPEVRFDGNSSHWGESDHGLIHTARLAHERGMQVILKPHIWLVRSEEKWRSDIRMNSPEEWDAWFTNYANFILHYARVAEEGNMEALCIGTELHLTAVLHPEKWIEIIKKVREVYSGKLTYAANFYKEFEEITFWNHLDAIGVQGYFPVSKNKNPTKEELCASWKPHKEKMQSMYERYGKPIIFTEAGYKNSDDAAIEPWVWPHRMEEKVVSEETQAVCLDAMFESLWQEDWFAGIFIWKWFHSSYKYTQEEYAEYRAERQRRRIEKGGSTPGPRITFSPQGMQGEKVMQKWYQRQVEEEKKAPRSDE